MFAVAWRYNERSPWNLVARPLPSEQDARAEINGLSRMDLVPRQARIIPLGEADSWPDPYAEQAEREQE